MNSVQSDIPLVFVFMITYNHEPYISEAIESVLMQKTNFEYILVIGEDCSTDKTREICISYQKRYYRKIKLLLNEKNIGVNRNVIQVLEACNGKYTAICEGDDYWIDPLKLQKQIDFLESHNDYSMCFHRSLIRSSDANLNNRLNNLVETSKEYNGLQAYKNTVFQSGSMVFRTSSFKYPHHFTEYIFPDNGIILSLIFNGKIFGFSDVMSVYRKHEGGLSFPSWEKSLKFIKMMDLIDEDFGPRVYEATKYRRFNRFYYLASFYIKQQNRNYFIKSITNCLKYDPQFLLSKKFYRLIMEYFSVAIKKS